MFLGIISPITTCRKTTIDRPIAKAIGWRNDSGTCSASRRGSIRWARVGSATAPSTSEQTVMPSWLTAITSDMFSIARNVVRANRLPAWARGSIWERRAETSANSARRERVAELNRRLEHEIAAPLLPSGSVLTGEQPNGRPVDPEDRPC
jgi:hypothetical protein